MNTKYDIILFDLDGTLLDTSYGIFNSVRYAENKMNLKAIDSSNLVKFIGPPPHKLYKELYNLSEEESKLAESYHRTYSKLNSIYESKVYNDIEFCLKELRKNGYKLGVATLKLEETAIKILNYFNLAKYFDVICGVSINDKQSKKDVIIRACNIIGDGKAILIGDTIYDLEGALEANIDFLPVLYGFGFSNMDELKEHSITVAADVPKKILDILL